MPSSSDKKNLLKKYKTTIPTARHTKPTGVKEKNDSASNPFFSSSLLTIIFGGVAISVRIPILLANANGMRNRLGLTLALTAILTTIGIITATVPVLLTKAPIDAVTSITSTKSLISLSPASLNILELISFANPVRKIPPPTTNNPIIIITTGLENPDKASDGNNIPVTTKANKAQIATKSARTFPCIKKIDDTNNIINVIFIGVKSCINDIS